MCFERGLAVFAMDVEGAANDLQIWDFVRVVVDERGIRFQACLPVLRDLFEFFHVTALGYIIQALGWYLVVDAQEVVDNCIATFQLVKKPSALAVIQDEFVFCLAIHLFLIKIRTWTAIGNEPVIRCKVKLWHEWFGTLWSMQM